MEQTAGAAAELLGVSTQEVLVSSTGVIGVVMPIDKILKGVQTLVDQLGDDAVSYTHLSRLEDAANKKVSTYSGGMRRRLDITMSLMGNPEVLFLDEPTTGLDPQNRIAMWDLVKDLAKAGTTVFLTTQYLEEAEYLADTIAILHEGKIIAEGTTKYLKEIMPERGIRLIFDSEIKANTAIKLLTENGISADSIEQNFPSLEDVFLTLIDEKKERNQYEKIQ